MQAHLRSELCMMAAHLQELCIGTHKHKHAPHNVSAADTLCPLHLQEVHERCGLILKLAAIHLVDMCNMCKVTFHGIAKEQVD